jgi:hypothetical protein
MEKKETSLIESSSLRIEKDIIVMDVGQTKMKDGIEKQKTHLNMLLKRRF